MFKVNVGVTGKFVKLGLKGEESDSEMHSGSVISRKMVGNSIDR